MAFSGQEIIFALRAAIHGTFSIKLRAGYDHLEQIFTLLPLFEEAQVDFLVLHPRTDPGDVLILTMAHFPRREEMDALQLGRIGGERVFARYLRSETGFTAHGHIRKYDGEPFMPHHIVEAVKAQLAGATTLSIPVHEVCA